MSPPHLLHPTYLTYRRISARHDLRPRTVAVANENPRPSNAVVRQGASPSSCSLPDAPFSQSMLDRAARAPAVEPIGSPDGPGAVRSLAAPAFNLSSFRHSTGDNRA